MDPEGDRGSGTPLENHKFYGFLYKAVVAGPAGRRAPDHYFGRVCFFRVPFFSFGSFFFVLTPDFQFIDAIINNARCACHP